MPPIYLDCNATTPMEPEVAEIMMKYAVVEFGNPGSRTHIYGQNAKKAVNKAREQVAAVVDATPDEVIFTSGATESNNIAILGLLPYGEKENKHHIITTAIEHKAILEPLKEAERRGFEVTYIFPNSGGVISAEDVKKVLRKDTLLVSVMHVNNETGAIQPIKDICDVLKDHNAYFHCDAAQGYGKILPDLRNKRIDMISASAHKIYGPKGIGALVTRVREYNLPPLAPLIFGGGQERNLRPGTQPSHLIGGFGMASHLCINDNAKRNSYNTKIFHSLINILPKSVLINSDTSKTIHTTLNIALNSFDSETFLLVAKDSIAISNGSACTSRNYTGSHVLSAHKYSDSRINSSIRISWCHLTPHDIAVSAISSLLSHI